MPLWLKKFVLFVLRKAYSRTFDGLSKVKIMVGPLKGKKMVLNFNAGNGATDTEYLAGYRQEREEIDLLRKLVSKGQTIWDIGIYRGFYSVLFSELTGPDGKILRF